MNYFVTGTDTGVGKTLLSCALLHAFAARGLRVAGMKPVAAGCGDDGVNDDVRQLREAGTISVADSMVNPYCFRLAAAPHLAAQHEGARIEFGRILAAYDELAQKAELVIVEGVGGFRVPLNETQDSAELARQLGLPVIMVVGMRLGCLNHALLTADAVAAQGLELAGWVANILDADMPVLQENIAALRERIAAPLLGVVPQMTQPDAKVAAAQLNLELLKGHA